MRSVRLFLASSNELKEDRSDFEIFLARKNEQWRDKGVAISLVHWEDFIDALSKTRLQDEYNKAIRGCELFVMLFWSKVGPYTEEEFDTALDQFKQTGKPLIYTYFKAAPDVDGGNEDELISLLAFKKRLKELEHFVTMYESIDALKFHFNGQLEKLLAEGCFGTAPGQPNTPPTSTGRASLTGSGAIAQGTGATGVGAGGVHVGGNNTGSINTGTQVNTGGGAFVGGNATAGGHFIGRDFVQHITNVVRKDEDAGEAQSLIAHYLQVLVADLAGLRLGEIDLSAQQARREPLQLADIYVPLDTATRIQADMTLAQWLARATDSDRYDLQQSERRNVSALEALAEHRQLTLLGKPGSGKSTFGAHVLLALAQAWQGHEAELARLGEQWTHGPLLPIRVVLRRFADSLPAGAAPAHAGDIWAQIGRELEAAGIGLAGEAVKYLQRIARKQGALILFDGLDECGDPASRERVRAAVDELMRSAGPNCRFMLTARPYAWPGGPEPDTGVYALADFADPQIEQFIHAWYAALAARGWIATSAEAQRKAADLLKARHRPDLQPLARNPLLLTLMATLHANRGRLPEDRADLYDESVDLLLLRWNRQIGADKALLDQLAVPDLKLPELREALEALAFKAHQDSAHHDAASTAAADIGEDRLIRAFKPLLNDSRDKAAIVVDYIEKRAGLLVGQGERDGERQFSFPHRTFQEYLAACHLAAQDDLPAACVRLARAAPGHWQEVLSLAARVARAERGASAADELIGGVDIASLRRHGRPASDDWICALLAGLQLREIGVGGIRSRPRTRAILERVAGWIAASLPVHPDDGGLSAGVRARAGDELSALGDPRFDPLRCHLPAEEMLGFVRIAADPGFKIGVRKADADRIARLVGHDIPTELNDEPTPTAEFWIARYPVTVAQFREFVETTRFEPGDPDVLREPDNRPVRFVSWHESISYCAWLNDLLAAATQFDGNQLARLVREQGWRVTLPSELEWEKAARGGLPDALYPWGDEADPERANCDETGIDDSSTVGCFAPNGFGLYDVAGNVWQWTRSFYALYPYGADDGRESTEATGELRIVRGGSWDSPRGDARCAVRYGNHPDVRFSDLGFRVVLRSAPVS